ncbi:MAG: DUF2723 domain-containing protein [Polyangiales bacterium]
MRRFASVVVLGPKHSRWFATAALALYYSVTTSRDLSLYDSGELALAAHVLGLGHPPGQPLHTLLGHLATWLVPSALFGINLVSALPAALSLLPAASVAERLAGPELPRSVQHCMPWLLALFALHESVWEPATRVEVYTLATWAALWAVAWALPQPTLTRPRFLRRVGAIGLAIGLCASVNPVIAAAAGCSLLPLLSANAWAQGLLVPALLRAALGCALGLVPYLYLPLVAAYGRAMIWGGLQDGASYVRYLTLRDYARNQTLGLGAFIQHAALWCGWATQHLLTPVLILGLAAFVRLGWRWPGGRWLLPIAFAIGLAMISFNVVWDLQVPDYNGYLGLAYWLAAAGAVALSARLFAQQRRSASLAIAVCLVAGWLVPPQPWARTRQHDRVARALAEQVLREAPTGAIVITESDYSAGTLFYLQQAEHVRPDVSVLVYGLAGSSWHWRHLLQQHPELTGVDLNARGSRAARVQRWLADNPNHPALVERLPLATALGLRVCPGGLFLRTGVLCDAARPPLRAASELLAEQLAIVGRGSPSTAEAIAEVSEHLGLALWQLGWPREAYDVWLAGVPRPEGLRALTDQDALARVTTPPARAPAWQRSAALGDPGRNLYLAGAIVHASGQRAAAERYLLSAARTGLPEAQRVLTADTTRSSP